MPEIHYIVNWTDLGYNPLMPAFYSSTGDDGYTGLLQEGRVSKNHPIPEAVGTIDEASSVLGMARALVEDGPSKMMILTIQRDLYNLMAEVSASPNNSAHFRAVDSDRVEWLEQQVELLTTKVKVTKEFIVPGDSFTGAVLDLARTVVRRAERQIAGLIHTGVVENLDLLRYLNRLSTFCFAMELFQLQNFAGILPTLAKDRP